MDDSTVPPTRGATRTWQGLVCVCVCANMKTHAVPDPIPPDKAQPQGRERGAHSRTDASDDLQRASKRGLVTDVRPAPSTPPHTV